MRWITMLLLVGAGGFAVGAPLDSVRHMAPTSKPNKISFMATGRVHTAGVFLYMGRVVNHNPAADLFLNVSAPRGWGLSVFKVWDLNEAHSGNNFMFGFLHKTFRLSPKLTVAPWVGGGLEQNHGFVSHGSDFMLQLVSNYKFNSQLNLEHIALFNNLYFEPSFADWTNRFKLTYSKAHVDVSGFFWHNNNLLDGRDYTSAGLGIHYTRVPISKKLWLGAGATTLATLASSNEERVPLRSVIQFNTIITFK